MKAIVSIICLAASAAALAAPVMPDPDPRARPRLGDNGVTMGTVHIAYEETTLAAVRAQAGIGVLRHQADATITRSWLCYVLPDRVRAVWLIANGEGASTRAITQVQVGPIDPSEQCPLLPEALQPLKFHNGASAGMSSDALRKALGTPSGASPREMTWVSEEKVQEQRDRARLRIFKVRLKNGLVDALQAGQTTY
ncbi:hypothetical protein E4L96_12715 [Massilia arenosa]|uniref:Uncharacterized protein n=1 Tax=Zemynaea arenosa TaxID=2561931 RepID=A0A4Y9SFL1_9BURK|nr:hypothetical protein [Massilia arenosa]TFW18766.1 hypothetical protein E4L96_12715 [Massilia arenosa]